MTENFLHYVWQYQQYNFNGLKTVDGLPVKVLKTGLLNSNSGPDFSNARLMIDKIEWVGQVEIHLQSADWNLHKHSLDPAYDNVILHVVWEDTGPVMRKDGTAIPTLELKNIVHKNVLRNYHNLLRNPSDILCEPYFDTVPDLVRFSMMDKALAHRLRHKTADLFVLWKKNQFDWEKTTYQWLARNFGFKLNADAFFRLSEVLPVKILQKHRDSLFRTEALIFGQAGFLDEPADDYSKDLLAEYRFLASKYGLHSAKMSRHEWKFLRTRPYSFPTVRLAQFARMISSVQGLFSFFTETRDTAMIIQKLSVVPSEYWLEHYDFGKKNKVRSGKIGESSVENIVINTVINLLAAYSNSIDSPEHFERAVEILEKIRPEKNHITEKWQNLGLKIKTGFDSQALIEQYNGLCLRKKCVECPVGADLLKKQENPG